MKMRALIKTLRPRQWTKNAFILAALVFDHQLTHVPALLRTLAAFALFCFLSSAVYIINDIMDVEIDRNHPTKKNRPIASGQISAFFAIIFVIVLLAVIFPLAFWLSPYFALVCAIYLLINLLYSKWLKHIPLIDVLVIASGFVLRVVAGVSVIHVERFSPWLYIVTTLFALYIGFGKRRAEMVQVSNDVNNTRPVLNGYSLTLLDQLITIVSATTVVSYSLYTFSAPNLPENHSMMLTIPFVLYGIFRYLYLIQIKQAGGEPEELLLRDRPLQITIILWAIAILLIFYLQ